MWLTRLHRGHGDEADEVEENRIQWSDMIRDFYSPFKGRVDEVSKTLVSFKGTMDEVTSTSATSADDRW
jgi:hypothetical protein